MFIMDYHLLNKEEVNRMTEIDRTEVINNIYYYKESKLDLKEEHWQIPRWNQQQIQTHIISLLDIDDKGGQIFGAFMDSRLVGIIALDNEFIGRKKDQLDIAGFWVSKVYRKKGVGTALIELVKKKAKKIGAKKLYVSATPSKNTVNFYMKRGFKLAKEIDQKKYEQEPEDIHMELKLT